MRVTTLVNGLPGFDGLDTLHGRRDGLGVRLRERLHVQSRLSGVGVINTNLRAFYSFFAPTGGSGMPVMSPVRATEATPTSTRAMRM